MSLKIKGTSNPHLGDTGLSKRQDVTGRQGVGRFNRNSTIIHPLCAVRSLDAPQVGLYFTLDIERQPHPRNVQLKSLEHGEAS